MFFNLCQLHLAIILSGVFQYTLALTGNLISTGLRSLHSFIISVSCILQSLSLDY